MSSGISDKFCVQFDMLSIMDWLRSIDITYQYTHVLPYTQIDDVYKLNNIINIFIDDIGNQHILWYNKLSVIC